MKILESQRGGELPVRAIMEQTGLLQSNLSNHLSYLCDGGLVTTEQQGKFVEYRLSDPRMDERLMLSKTLPSDWWRTGEHEEIGTITLQQVSYYASHKFTHLSQIKALTS